MQTIRWYVQRLRAMSIDEIAWRAQSFLRDRAERILISRRQRPRRLSTILNGDGGKTPGFHVCDMAVRENAKSDELSDVEKAWYSSLLERAEKIRQHRLSFFDLKDQHLGDPISWNRDHKRGQDTPMVFSPALDYRDVANAGDCKFVWEPNRHHQLVVLGRAYRVSGEIGRAHV